MPPRTRAAKTTKSLKENIGIEQKTKLKTTGKVDRPARKVLGDKTNSASDDNTAIEPAKNVVKKTVESAKIAKLDPQNENKSKPRRDRRVPSRFMDNQLLNNLSKSRDKTPVASTTKNDKTPAKSESSICSPFKTPNKIAETSLVTTRPRRVCRLPSKFEDHSISPHKFIPVQPCHASTPILQNSTKPASTGKGSTSDNTTPTTVRPKSSSDKSIPTKQTVQETKKNKGIQKVSQKVSPDTNNTKPLATTGKGSTSVNTAPTTVQPKLSSDKSIPSKQTVQETKKKKGIQKVSQKVSPDTNNNAKGRVLRARTNVDVKDSKGTEEVKSPTKKFNNKKKIESPKKPSPKKIRNKNFMFKVLEDNKPNTSNLDIYEFTFDPDEEPPPQKKKKKVVKKRPAKPKTVVFKNNYDRNVAKALEALKNAMGKNQTERKRNVDPRKVPEVIVTDVDKDSNVENTEKQPVNNIPQIQRNIASKIIIGNGAPSSQSNSNISNVPTIQQNVVVNIPTNKSTAKVAEPHKSIQIEDIAADFEASSDNDLNYSPVNSPCPNTSLIHQTSFPVPENKNDPLNLRDNISFFDEPPVASSSMNMSVRHPQASPWRVEFENLPIRWHVNSYVKPNMTPAVESSFVNFDDKNKKKHVYTNLVPESNAALPEIVDKSAPNLIQTSIISFIREVMEKSSTKKQRARSVTPMTPHLFVDGANKTPNKTPDKKETSETEPKSKATRQLFTPKKKSQKDLENVKETSSDKENSKESSKGKKRKNEDEPDVGPAKTPRKEKDNTFFGFDESDIDQENVSPKKNVVERPKRSLRPRARAVLKEINEQGPTRAALPVAAKTQITEIEKLYDQIKSASDAPVFPEKEQTNVGTNIEPIQEITNEDSQSVHLFEDIEFIHHLKPQRKSYGKAKKVTFSKNTSDSDTQSTAHAAGSDNEGDDPNDLTFDLAVPFIEEQKKPKKKTKRQKMTKKEIEEADAWAAGFNSMCEDVEGFDLVVE